MIRRKFISVLTGGTALTFAAGLASRRLTSEYLQLYEGIVAGYPYHNGDKVADHMIPGYMFQMQREPHNPHDHKAIALYCENVKIGYVPRVDNDSLAALMDNGYTLRAICKKYDPHVNPWEAVTFKVEMEKV